VRPLRHPHQTTTRKSIKWPLAEPAEAGHGPSAAGDDNLASPLHSLQVLAEAIVELTDPDFVLCLM
jgi:hypothetical protein